MSERIRELEAEIITRTSYGDEQTDFAIKLAAERDALRAQLAEIDAAEPVAWQYKGTATMCLHYKEGYEPAGEGWQPLFTRPMPAQDVTELVDALQLFADALPLERSTVKTCYAVTNQMRDSVHAALSRYKGAK